MRLFLLLCLLFPTLSHAQPSGYDSLVPLPYYDLYIAFANGKAGIVNKDNAIKTPFHYSDIQLINYYDGDWDKFIYRVEDGNKVGAIRGDNDTLVSLLYDDVELYQNRGILNRFIVHNADYVGFVKSGDKVILPPKFDSFDLNGNLIRVHRDGKYGFYQQDSLIIPIEYNYATLFGSGFSAVLKDGKWGYINTSNEIIVPFENEHADAVRNGYGIFKKKGKYGFINKYGHIEPAAHEALAPLKSTNRFNYNNSHLLRAKSENKYTIISTYGDTVSPILFDSVSLETDNYEQSSHLYKVFVNGKVGAIDGNGVIVFSPIYDTLKTFRIHYKYMAIATKDNATGIIDEDGTIRTPFRQNYYLSTTYYGGWESNPGWRRFSGVLNKKNAWIDERGFERFPPLYEGSRYYPLSDSSLLVSFKKDSLYAFSFIENAKKPEQQKLLFLPVFTSIKEVTYNTFIMEIDQMKGLYAFDERTQKMHALLPPTYEQITSLGNGLFASYLRDSITLYIKDSTSLTAHLQDNFSSVKAKNGLLFIEQNDKIGVFYYNQKLRTISQLSPFNFDSVESTKKYHHVIVKKKNKYGLYSHDIINNEFILRIPIKYDYISLSGSRNFYAVKRFTQNKERVIRYKYSRKQKKVILKEKFWRTRDQY